MAPGNPLLYMQLSLKIRGIIKLLSHRVGLQNGMCMHLYLFVHASIYLSVVFRVCEEKECVCVYVREEQTVTEIDGEGKAGHYVV